MLSVRLADLGGATPVVVDDSSIPATGDLVSIGITSLSDDLNTDDLGPWGRKIHRSGRCTRIVSGSRQESIWGAAELYLDKLGIRHYGPNPIWISKPKSMTSLHVTNSSQVPDMNHVRMSNWWKPDDLEYGVPGLSMLWDRSGMEYDSHTFGKLLTIDSFDLYPTIRPTYDGVETTPTEEQIALCSRWQPCMHYTSDLADALMPAVSASLESYEMVQVSVNDNGGYCDCDECQDDIAVAGDEVTAYSKQYHALLAEIAGRVAAEHPAATVVGLAYDRVAGLPQVRLPDNVLILNLQLRPGDPTSPLPNYDNLADEWREKVGIGIYDRFHGSGSVHPRILTSHISRCFRSARPKALVMEGSPSWGLNLAQNWILRQLSWDIDADVDGLWLQWAIDLFGPASGRILDYVAALERLTWATTNPPPSGLGNYRSQLEPGPGQLEAVADASAAIAAAGAVDGLSGEESERIEIIRTAWDVPKTLVTWSNSETPPTPADEAAFWDRFAAIEADDRTIWRTSLDALRSGVQDAVDYAARRTSEYEWPVKLGPVTPTPYTWTDVDLGESSSWRIDWTSIRGNTPGRARLLAADDAGNIVSIGRWSADGDQWLVYIEDHYVETSFRCDEIFATFIAEESGWRMFINGRQIIGGSDQLRLPTKFMSRPDGDEQMLGVTWRSL